jgi:outer membrane protein OmpA-like peptidoglycan-associated protein
MWKFAEEGTMKPLLRLLWMPALALALASASLASEPDTPKSAAKKSESTGAETPAAKSKSAKKARKQGKAKAAKPASTAETAPVSVYKPVPTLTGTNGLLTIESGETLPAKTIATTAGVNKFARAPGSVTILNTQLGVAVGITDRLSLFLDFTPHSHLHVIRPTELSLNPLTLGCPLVRGTIYRSISCSATGAASYVEDYPFANHNGGGIGEITAGIKFNLLSQHRGDPFGLSVRGDLIFQTVNGLSSLLDNESQAGQFNFGLTAAATRSFGQTLEASLNLGVRLTRNPRSGGSELLNQAKQFKAGFGMLMFPRSRFQIISEYGGTVFFGNATPNTTFGPRDPMEAIWGLRMYPWKEVAVDIGYRYMINLNGNSDRHGFIAKIGTAWTSAPPPPPPNRPPTATCSADKASVFAGSGDSINVTVAASDPDSHPLTYTYTATGGAVEGTGPEARWNSDALAVGSYSVTAHVDDAHGGVATCSVDLKVDPRPNRPPVMTCSAERATAIAGERVRINATASDPDNDPLSYSWRSNGGQIIGSGASVQLDTTGLNPGNYRVTGRVDDGRGGAADCNADVKVEAPAQPPQSSKLNECFFRSGSARVDNVCKRVLDDVALRLAASPRDKVVIVGYADPKEAKPEKLAKQRADSAKKYLGGKGVAAARVETRAAGGQKGAGKQNRRMDVILVPEGATF